MAPPDKILFSGAGNLCDGDTEKVIVTNFNEDADRALKSMGWDGISGAAFVGLVIGIDNDTVDRSALVMRGQLEAKTVWTDAAKVWPGASSEAALAVRFPTADIFNFSDGTMTSDIVPQELVTHGIYKVKEGKQAEEIPEQDYEKYGVRGFSLRAVAALSKRSGPRNGIVLKVTLLIFPEEKATLLQKFEGAQQAAWPGMRLLESYMPLLPRATTPWGCPIAPLLLLGTPAEDNSSIPSGEELRRAVAATLTTAIAPNTGRTAQALVAKWDRWQSNPEEITAREPETTWPAATTTSSHVTGE